MRSRMTLACMGFVLAVSVLPALAANEPAAPLPVYPGGKLTLELNLTERDLLPMVRNLIVMLPGLLGATSGEKERTASGDQKPGGAAATAVKDALGEGSVVAKLQKVMAGLRQVSVLCYEVPPAAEANRIADFYMEKLGLTKGWQSAVRLEQPRSSFRLYTRPDLEGMFGLLVKDSRVTAFRTVGKVDLTDLGELVACFAAARESELKPAGAEKPETTTGKPAPVQTNSERE